MQEKHTGFQNPDELSGPELLKSLSLIKGDSVSSCVTLALPANCQYV